MFKIVEKPTFTHDVKVLTPVDDGFAEDVLKTTFNYLPTDEVAKFDLKTPEGTTEFLRAIVAGLHELVDENGKPLTCTVELRDRLLFLPGIRNGLVAHYLDAVTRIKEGN